MLETLKIRNFRLFKALDVEGLRRVNLVSGMNNSGKTALLEALRIWAAGGDTTVVNATLDARGEFTPGWGESYEHLFHSQAQDDRDSLIINEIVIFRTEENNIKKRDYFVTNPNLPGKNTPTKNELIPSGGVAFPKDACVYVPFALKAFPLEQLWKGIALTKSKDAVLEIVKQADPKVVDLDVRSDGVRVRHDDFAEPISMGRLGDGVVQTLKIAAGLAAAYKTEKRLLLLDEIESGLHHTVQQLVWEKIFRYAVEWDVQVFATTHSQDAVRTFADVSSQTKNKGQGCYFRLERDANGQIKAVMYDTEKLITSIEYDLETR